MAAFRYPRTSQPQWVAEVDRGNPICRGLEFALLPNSPLRGKSLVGYGVDGVRVVGLVTDSRNRSTTSPFTVLAVGAFNTSLTPNPSLFSASSTWASAGNNSGAILFRNNTSGVLSFGIWNNNNLTLTIAGSSPLGTKLNLVGSYDGATARFYSAGVLKTSSASTGARVTASTIDVGSSGGNGVAGCSLAAVWNRALSDAEINSLSTNPWQIFATQSRQILAPASVSIYRPSSDVLTTGWTGTPDNTDLYKNIDEVTASDTDYITSPTITGGESTIMGLSGSLVAGTWDVRYRANFTGTSAEVRITLLDGSNVSQGASSWQTVTSSFADYTAQITTTGTATRVMIEVQ